MTDPHIVIRKSQFVLEFIKRGRTATYPVAIGSNPDGADKVEAGDSRTPEGEFTIASIEDSSEWEREGERVYGPLFLRLDCPPWVGIGIHGTNDPDSTGTRASLGCIRMRNEDLVLMAQEVPVGTSVKIVP